jgi:hypothetical protein
VGGKHRAANDIEAEILVGLPQVIGGAGATPAVRSRDVEV